MRGPELPLELLGGGPRDFWAVQGSGVPGLGAGRFEDDAEVSSLPDGVSSDDINWEQIQKEAYDFREGGRGRGILATRSPGL